MQALNLPVPRPLRSLSLAWRHGALARRAATGAAVLCLLALAAGSAVAWRAHRQAQELDASAARLEALRAAVIASARDAEPPDVVATLPAAPTVAEIMRTMQRAADAENASVVSVQAEQRPPTALELGRLDLVVSIKAPYPAILVVLREVLDRYPGATLRQLNLVHAAAGSGGSPIAAPIAAMPGASSPVVESEARATLAFWSRPPGVARVARAPAETLVAAAAVSTPAWAPASVPVVGPLNDTSTPGASVASSAALALRAPPASIASAPRSR